LYCTVLLAGFFDSHVGPECTTQLQSRVASSIGVVDHGAMPEMWNASGSDMKARGYPMVYFLVWVVHSELRRISCFLTTGVVTLAKSDVLGPPRSVGDSGSYPKVMRHQCIVFFSYILRVEKIFPPRV